VVRRSRRQKANKLKLVKQCGRQASKIKALRFEMFLKWRHSAPIFHYAVNFIGRGRSGKFKDSFHGKKALEFSFFSLNIFLDVIEIPKPQKPCWPYRHFKSTPISWKHPTSLKKYSKADPYSQVGRGPSLVQNGAVNNMLLQIKGSHCKFVVHFFLLSCLRFLEDLSLLRWAENNVNYVVGINPTKSPLKVK